MVKNEDCLLMAFQKMGEKGDSVNYTNSLKTRGKTTMHQVTDDD